MQLGKRDVSQSRQYDNCKTVRFGTQIRQWVTIETQNCRRCDQTERKRSCLNPPVRLRHPHDGADDAVVAAAATQIAVERAANLGFGRPRIAIEQVGRHNDHAVGAVAALGGLLLDERLLEHVRLVDGDLRGS